MDHTFLELNFYLSLIVKRLKRIGHNGLDNSPSLSKLYKKKLGQDSILR